MKKLLLFVFITTLSITSSFAQAAISSDIGQLKPFVTYKNTASDIKQFFVGVLNPTNLNDLIYINAPSGFELSSDAYFSNPQTTIVCPLSIFTSQYNQFQKTFYIKIASTALVGTFSKELTIKSNNTSILQYSTYLTGEVKGLINILSYNNSLTTYSTTDFPRGRNTTTSCKTSTLDENTIDVFYPFIANNSTTSIDLTVGNSAWLSTMELVDTLTYASIANTCQSNVGVGFSTRTYNFAGLTVGQKYMVRLEIGDTAPLGHARMEAVDNTFSIKLNSTVTDVSEKNTKTSIKTISNIYNLQGLEVSKDFRGLVIYKYSDGTTQKVVQE